MMFDATTPVRPAAVAGSFYPAEADTLRAQVEGLLAGAVAVTSGLTRPKLLIVPHAGYIYSGPIAASAYARLAAVAASVRRVVLLGPTHRVSLRGLAAPTVAAFETPLGRVPLDRAALDMLDDLPQVVRSDQAHAQEHSLEVQLPFLQRALGDGFTLVPLAVGDAGAADVAEVLERLWGGDETLIVISSDLSHYRPYAQAQDIDRRTVARIVAAATDLMPHEACGAHALNGALLAAGRHGLALQLLDLRNSGDTAGDRARVVGYAAFAASAAPAAVDGDDDSDDDAQTGLGGALLARARNAIRAPLALGAEFEPAHAALTAPGATFVTLKDKLGRLRGCIGALRAERALDDDVRRHAHAAAFDDPRFAPLRAHEWPDLQIEVSVLGPSQLLPRAPSIAVAASHLRAGVDGVTLDWRGRRATLLPQVWAELPHAEDFLVALGHKAGLPAGAWHEDIRLSRYSVRHFSGVAS